MTAATILKARAILAAHQVDPSISKADALTALAELLAEAPHVDAPGPKFIEPAFPCNELNHDGSVYEQFYGVNLRDYFAARAPITVEDAMLAVGATASCLGMLSRDERKCAMAGLAQMQFDYADAMLRERAQ